MISETFSIAGLRFRLELPHKIRITHAFLPFRVEDGPADIDVHVVEVPQLPKIGGREIFRDLFCSVHDIDGRFCKCYFEHLNANRGYALTEYDWDSGTVQVCYEAGNERFFSESQNSFTHIGFEEILMSRERLILHASLISTPFGGILFSGPSGIGKSTQADLWHQYEGSSILNGDRPILYRNHGVWEAWGSPYAGSSGYHVNQKASIRAIVMLEQGQKCLLHRMSGRMAFCRLYAQTTFNSWDPRFCTKACNMLESLVETVPVYHFSCTKDEIAVRVLKQELRGGESNG